jgi:hypothetical protein
VRKKMKAPTWRVWAFVGAVVALTPASTPQAAPEPAASGTSAASAAGSAVAPPVGEPLGPHWPRDESDVPTVEEWKTATAVRLSRVGYRALECRASRVREWLKIHCGEVLTASISVLGGDNDHVHLWRPPADANGQPQKGADVVMAVRPGDARVLQVWAIGFGYEGFGGIEPVFTISEQWVEGEGAPLVTVG